MTTFQPNTNVVTMSCVHWDSTGLFWILVNLVKSDLSLILLLLLTSISVDILMILQSILLRVYMRFRKYCCNNILISIRFSFLGQYSTNIPEDDLAYLSWIHVLNLGQNHYNPHMVL